MTDARLLTASVGSGYTHRAAFRDDDGAPIDPSAVTFKAKAPDATVTTYTYPADTQIVKDAVGRYHVVHVPTAAGAWHFEFAGTGATYNRVFTGLLVATDAVP